MNVYLFRDGNGDLAIVAAVTLAAAEALLDRAEAASQISVFTNSTRVHIPVDGTGDGTNKNVYGLRQLVNDANFTSERILFEVD